VGRTTQAPNPSFGSVTGAPLDGGGDGRVGIPPSVSGRARRGGWWMATVAQRRSAVAYESGSFR